MNLSINIVFALLRSLFFIFVIMFVIAVIAVVVAPVFIGID